MSHQMPSYVADLQKLVGLAGHKLTNDKDPMLVEQIIAGLRTSYSSELQMSMSSRECMVDSCLELINVLRALSNDMQMLSNPVEGIAATTTVTKSCRFPHVHNCYSCGATGHMKRDCPASEKNRAQTTKSHTQKNGRQQLTCYFCYQTRHMMRDCPEHKRWEAKRSTKVATTVDRTTASKDGACLVATTVVMERAVDGLCLAATTVVTERAVLPNIYADVRPAESQQTWTRARAVVDTGATRTLVSLPFLTMNGLGYDSNETQRLSALNGSPLKLVGTAELEMERQEGGPVHLPTVKVKAGVVPNLTIIDADLLLGTDIVKSIGGIRLQYSNGILQSAAYGAQVTLQQPQHLHPCPMAIHPGTCDLTSLDRTLSYL